MVATPHTHYNFFLGDTEILTTYHYSNVLFYVANITLFKYD
jgi:hypothetical protein